MSDETVLESKQVSYGFVELVKFFSFPGTITYWIRINGELRYGSYSQLSGAQEKFRSLY